MAASARAVGATGGVLETPSESSARPQHGGVSPVRVSTTDQDWRMRTPNDVWVVYWARQTVMNPLEGGVIARPHREREAQRLFQPLEAFA
jgi:hypothetical protein